MSTQVTFTPEQPVDEAMAKAVAEAQAAENAPAPVERPQWLPEKFKSPEDLAKAYSELEKRFSAPADKPKAAEQTDAGTPGALNFDSYAEEYANTGDLSEESIQKIVAQGIPENLVRNYVNGVKALGDVQTQQIYSMAGGEAQYNSMLEWASENLEDGEIDAFNEIMDGGNTASMQMAVRGLQARYVQMNGQPAKLIQGEVTGPSGGVFRSVAEVVAAMKDPKYHKDPAYRRDIENRLKNSDVFGITNR